jgi:aryl-alcohol dehydrogenase-like predicted oxidoreductase
MLNKIILGTAQLGMKYGINNYGSLSKSQSFNILDFAFENKIEYLDIAESYGNIKELLGLYFKEKPQNKFKIFSKLNLNDVYAVNNTKTHINNQLNKMNVNSIYGYMFHSYSELVKFPKVLESLQELKEDGIISKIGVSLYENSEAISVLDNYDLDFIQLPFNLLDNQSQKEDIFEIYKKKKIEIHARSIFLQGLFFKPYSKYDSQLKPLIPYMKEIDRIVKKSKSNLDTMAINYPLEKEYIDKVIFGVHNLSQFRRNIDSIESDSKLDCKEIEMIIVKEKELLKPLNWK